ncbi:MAG: S8 family peptidase, partial [Oscillochloris sp.]|nr:S8 family peptidase [Oscillochloris sp.]
MRFRPILHLQPWLALLLIGTLLIAAGPDSAGHDNMAAAPALGFIVQATSADAAALAVEQAGGTIEQRLNIINAVSATLTPAAYAALSRNPQIAVHADKTVRSSQGPGIGSASTIDPITGEELLFPSLSTDIDQVIDIETESPLRWCTSSGFFDYTQHASARHLAGYGVTVAVIDSGLMPSEWDYWRPLSNEPETLRRGCMRYRSFVDDQSEPVRNTSDPQGHGTHVVYTIADGAPVLFNTTWDDADDDIMPARGIAPHANLVIARALDADGGGSYANVIAAIDWIVSNKDRYKIRVLNLSLYAPVEGPYWADPLNQAVMRAWQAGIVVVTVAGNNGPDPGTITAPGNVPYVITVGAMKHRAYGASGEHELANFSARGPTESAFVKPDIVVQGTRVLAPLPNNSTIAQQMRNSRVASWLFGSVLGETHEIIPNPNHSYYYLSGTSMAAAQVSGVVALMLQQNPRLTNDEVKYRLLSTAIPAIDPATNRPRFTVWEQGAGQVHAKAAILTTDKGRANEGMDIAKDLSGKEHYWGNTIWDEANGEFQILDPKTAEPLEVWGAGRRTSSGGWIWSGGRRTSSGRLDRGAAA